MGYEVTNERNPTLKSFLKPVLGLALVGMLSVGASAQGSARSMADRLNLSQDQKQQIRQIVENANNPTTDAERQALQERIMGVLTAEQQAKLKEMAQRKAARKAQRAQEKQAEAQSQDTGVNAKNWQGGYFPGYYPGTGTPNSGYYPDQNQGYYPNGGYYPNQGGYYPNQGGYPNTGYYPNGGYYPNSPYYPNNPNTGYYPNGGYPTNNGGFGIGQILGAVLQSGMLNGILSNIFGRGGFGF